MRDDIGSVCASLARVAGHCVAEHRIVEKNWLKQNEDGWWTLTKHQRKNSFDECSLRKLPLTLHFVILCFWHCS